MLNGFYLVPFQKIAGPPKMSEIRSCQEKNARVFQHQTQGLRKPPDVRHMLNDFRAIYDMKFSAGFCQAGNIHVQKLTGGKMLAGCFQGPAIDIYARALEAQSMGRLNGKSLIAAHVQESFSACQSREFFDSPGSTLNLLVLLPQITFRDELGVVGVIKF